MARSAHGSALAAGVALAGVVLLAIRKRPRTSAGGLPSAIASIVRRHVGAADADDFGSAVREHVAAGKPLTRAALLMLGAIYFEPEQLDAIRADLKSAGIDKP